MMTQFLIKITKADLETLKKAAKCADVAIAEFIRGAALAKAKKVLRRQPQEKEKAKENISPTPPIREKEKEKENNDNDTTRARIRTYEQAEAFQVPTFKQVSEYVAREKLSFDPRQFFIYYETHNWLDWHENPIAWKTECHKWEAFERRHREKMKLQVRERTSRIEAQIKRMELPVSNRPDPEFDRIFEDGGK